MDDHTRAVRARLPGHDGPAPLRGRRPTATPLRRARQAHVRKGIHRVTKIANSGRYMSPAVKELRECNRTARRVG